MNLATLQRKPQRRIVRLQTAQRRQRNRHRLCPQRGGQPGKVQARDMAPRHQPHRRVVQLRQRSKAQWVAEVLELHQVVRGHDGRQLGHVTQRVNRNAQCPQGPCGRWFLQRLETQHAAHGLAAGNQRIAFGQRDQGPADATTEVGRDVQQPGWPDGHRQSGRLSDARRGRKSQTAVIGSTRRVDMPGIEVPSGTCTARWKRASRSSRCASMLSGRQWVSWPH